VYARIVVTVGIGNEPTRSLELFLDPLARLPEFTAKLGVA